LQGSDFWFTNSLIQATKVRSALVKPMHRSKIDFYNPSSL